MSWLYPIRFQWLEWTLALGFILLSVRNYFSPIRIKLPKHIEFITITTYLVIGIICKYSQWQALQLHAFDFWLFEDLMDHVAHGLGMVTRFAPQEPGPIQHGVIHGFWPLILLSPLVWLFGAFSVTLLFNPVVIVIAGHLLTKVCAQYDLRLLDRWLILIAFLFHSLTTEMLMHEMHPELIYPAIFFWLWNLSLKPSPRFLLPMLYFLIGSFKEDAAIFVLPILFLTASKKWNGAALLLGVVAHWGSMKLSGMMSSVRVPVVSAWGTANLSPFQIIEHLGGWFAVPRFWFRFMTESRTLFFLLSCPWLLIRKSFWILWIPYSFLFAFLGDRARLTNYYAAPFVAIFFLSIVIEFSQHKKHLKFKRAVLFLMALLVGSNGLVAYIPRSPTPEIKSALHSFNQILGKNPHAKGVVAAPFLGFVDRSKVWSDRVPLHADEWSQLSYLVLPDHWTNYEISALDLKRIEDTLSHDLNWKKVPSSSPFIQFWLRK